MSLARGSCTRGKRQFLSLLHEIQVQSLLSMKIHALSVSTEVCYLRPYFLRAAIYSSTVCCTAYWNSTVERVGRLRSTLDIIVGIGSAFIFTFCCLFLGVNLLFRASVLLKNSTLTHDTIHNERFASGKYMLSDRESCHTIFLRYGILPAGVLS